LETACKPSKAEPSHGNTNPCLSLEGLRKDYTNDPELLAGLDKTKDDLQAHYNSHYANTDSVMSPKEQLTGSPVKFNIFGRYAHKMVLLIIQTMNLRSISDSLTSLHHLKIPIH
jgi:hypothetical protein